MKKIGILLIVLLLFGCGSNATDVNAGKIIDNTNDSETIEEDDIAKYETITLSLGKPKKIEVEEYSDKYEFEITHVETYVTEEFYPPKPMQSYCTYCADQSGEKYIIYEYSIKNLSSDTIYDTLLENTFGDNCSHGLKCGDKYSYIGFFMMLEGDSNRGYDFSTFISIDPLQTKTIYYVVSVPNEAATLYSSCTICAGETEVISK